MQIIDGLIQPTRSMTINTQTAHRLNEFRLAAGDIVIGRRGEMGRCAVVRPEQAGWLCGTGSMIVRTAQSLDPGFAQRLLSSPPVVSAIENASVGSTMINLNQATLARLQVALPGRKEQTVIARALTDADALIESLEQLLAKKRLIKQGAMQELLSARRRLSGFSGDWSLKQLGEVSRIKTGGRNNEDKVEAGRYPFFVRSETVERIDSYSHDCEAILVPGEGRIGEVVHYVQGRFDVHQRVYAITNLSPSTNGKFLYFFMLRHFGAWATQNTVKATVDSLRLPTFQRFEIRLPPTIDEQAAIAATLSGMDSEIEVVELQLAKARQIKQGMMQNLLTGKVRLV